MKRDRSKGKRDCSLLFLTSLSPRKWMCSLTGGNVAEIRGWVEMNRCSKYNGCENDLFIMPAKVSKYHAKCHFLLNTRYVYSGSFNACMILIPIFIERNTCTTALQWEGSIKVQSVINNRESIIRSAAGFLRYLADSRRDFVDLKKKKERYYEVSSVSPFHSLVDRWTVEICKELPSMNYGNQVTLPTGY